MLSKGHFSVRLVEQRRGWKAVSRDYACKMLDGELEGIK
jgi:hypothetical protein